jgi:MFS family permease
MAINAVASLYVPAFYAIIAGSLPMDRKGTAFGAYRTLTSLPQIFMPFVSGYYLDVMGLGHGVRIGLILFTGAAVVAATLRAIFSRGAREDMETDYQDNFLDERNMLNTFKEMPRTIRARDQVKMSETIFLTSSCTY